MDPAKAKMTPRMVMVVIGLAFLLGVPAIYFTETQTGPAGVLIRWQDSFFGWHYSVSTMVIIMMCELLVLLIPVLLAAVLVRALTGKTLVEVFTRKPRSDSD